MVYLTLLTAQEWYARGSKEYSYNDSGNIIKTSDYKLGYDYTCREERVKNLDELCELLRGVSDSEPKTIRIHGKLRPDLLFSGGPVKRQKEFFSEPPEGVRLLNIDLDDWPCEPFSYENPETGARAIRGALRNQGFDFLADRDFVVLWSPSAWATDKIRAHIYFILDEPINLTLLKAWAKAVNARAEKKVLDGSVWTAVQPDYIAKRDVVAPLADPLTRDTRIFISRVGTPELNTGILRAEIDAAILASDGAAAGFLNPEDRITGIGWRATIAKCGIPGPDGDINSWGFRAAAQLVEERGPSKVRGNIYEYAKQLHDAAWEAIAKNAPHRGGGNDEITYNIDRFSQYLRSACDRGFGGAIDALRNDVFSAINAVIDTGDVSVLYEKNVLAACRELSFKRAGVWAEIQAEIKKNLRDYTSIGDFRKAVEKSVPAGITENSDPADTTEESITDVIKKVIHQYDWIYDEDGNRFLGRHATDESGATGGYEIKSLSDNLDNIFYHAGSQIEKSVPMTFGRAAVSYLLGSLSSSAPPEERGKWVKKIVGQQQVLTTDGTLWWRLSSGASLKITESAIEKIYDKSIGANSPVLWYSPGEVFPRDFVDTEKSEALNNISLLWKYVLCDERYRPSVLGWLLSCLSCASTQMVLELIGPSGSAKSSAGSALRDLIEPKSDNPFLFRPKERMTLKGQTKLDKYRVLKKNAVIFLDNLSGLDAEEQDFFCQVTTGICADIRIMYTSVLEEVSIKRPIIITGISPMITRPDLLSRSLQAHFGGRPEDTPGALTDSELPDSWARDRGKILSGLAWACQKMLCSRTSVTGRRGAYVAAMQALYGQEQGAAQALNDYRETQISVVSLNQFFMLFSHFIRREALEKGDGGVLRVMPSTLYRVYKSWIDENWGKTIEVLLAGDLHSVQVHHGDKTSGGGPIPAGPRGLGALISKYSHEFKGLCGIEISDARTGRARYKEVKVLLV